MSTKINKCVLVLLALRLLVAAPMSALAQGTNCLFVNPEFSPTGGGWQLGLGVVQGAGSMGMPHFSTIGQDITLPSGDWVLSLDVYVWKEPEVIISSSDVSSLISFYWQFPPTGEWVALSPEVRTFSEFATEDNSNVRRNFSVAVPAGSANRTGRFTIFALVNHSVAGVYGVAVDRACLTRTSTGGGGGNVDGGCDMYLPCGALPWQLPSLPDLRSPTPYAAPNPTFVATPTAVSMANIVPTATPPFDVDTFGDSVSTLQAIANATSVPILNLSGTPVNEGQVVATLTANTQTFFGYVRGLQAINFGVLTPLITLMFTAIFLFLSVNAAKFLFPMVMAILGVVRKIIQIILDFIPF